MEREEAVAELEEKTRDRWKDVPSPIYSRR